MDNLAKIGIATIDGNKVKGMMNAFMFFNTEQYQNIKELLQQLKMECKGKDITKRAGEMWKNMGDNEKMPYEIMATQDKARYQEEMARATFVRCPEKEMTAQEAARQKAEKEAEKEAKKAADKKKRVMAAMKKKAEKEASKQVDALKKQSQKELEKAQKEAAKQMESLQKKKDQEIEKLKKEAAKVAEKAKKAADAAAAKEKAKQEKEATKPSKKHKLDKENDRPAKVPKHSEDMGCWNSRIQDIKQEKASVLMPIQGKVFVDYHIQCAILYSFTRWWRNEERREKLSEGE